MRVCVCVCVCTYVTLVCCVLLFKVSTCGHAWYVCVCVCVDIYTTCIIEPVYKGHCAYHYIHMCEVYV